MSLIGTGVNTLADWAKKLDPDGKTATIVELLQLTNELLDDAYWQEGNLPTGHRTTVRTALPGVGWRRINEPSTPSKSQTAQIDEACGILEAWCEVDEELIKLNGNGNGFRLSEAMAFIEAMNNEMASTLFYGNSGTNQAQFNGLATRYNSLSSGNFKSNVLDGGGTGADNSSVWLVVWGPQTVFGIFPKGTKAGLTHDDYGVETVETTAGIGQGRLRAYRERWQWKSGLALRDWRYVVRLPNVDISNLSGKTSATDLRDKMIRMMHRIPNLKAGRAAFYMNRTCFQMLDIQARDDVRTGGQLKYENVDGQPTPFFRGVPVRKCDALLESEAAIS
jgi:hypothetical protein